jgi:putative peptide zinc metalloprotease protein
MLFIALTVQQLFPNSSAIFLSILKIIVLDIIIRIGFQCCVYMKTDLYYVIENFFGIYNLMESAQQAILRNIPFLRNIDKEEVTFESEKRIVFGYSIFYFFGVLLTISIFIFYLIPSFVYGWRNVLPGYTMPPTSLAFWDSAVFTVEVAIFLTILIRSWRKKYRKN